MILNSETLHNFNPYQSIPKFQNNLTSGYGELPEQNRGRKVKYKKNKKKKEKRSKTNESPHFVWET